ncbi:MAG: 50S ribosomal protein L32e [Methanobacteriota archaeon]|nr:MAG: 50S ribosomal protein L32e [Euryarchaeota archaeon]
MTLADDKSNDKDEFAGLRNFKEEYASKLKALGIETADDLAEALADEDRTEEIHEHLKGVGPKTLEHWREDLEEIDEDEDETGEEYVEIDEEGVVVDEDEGEDEEEGEEEEEVEIEEEEEGYRVKLKPELSKEVLDALKKRQTIDSRRPNFVRQEYHRRKRLQSTGWRRPRGLHSKMRTNRGYRTKAVSIGYGGPRQAKHLHPSGFQEVIVHNVKELEDIDPKVQAARVAHTVGMRKRTQIEDRADELQIRVLNRSG